MIYFYRLLFITLTCLILSACGGGGKAGCSVAVGGLACAGGNSGGGGGGGGSSNPTSSYSVLRSMGLNASEGAGLQAPLVQVNGVFYGTSQNGGSASLGTVFSVTATGQVTTIHSFVGGATDGAIPFAGLTVGSDGNLYGTTTNGGPNGYGTVFKVALTSGVATWSGVVYFFAGGVSDGANPFGGLIQGSDNAFYGTTTYGGTNNFGTVYRITLIGGVVAEAPIHVFSGALGVPLGDGEYPQSGLIKDSAGLMYGTTSGGGSAGVGTVYSVSTTGVTVILKQFSTIDGATTYASLLLGTDGNLYGTTTAGGSSGLGVAFSLSTNGLTYNALHSFTGLTTDGSTPYGNLVEINSILYGTTRYGGNYNSGTIFSLTKTGTETMVYSFGAPSDGANPYAGLILGSDGYYYGTTSAGGTGSNGTVYKFYP